MTPAARTFAAIAALAAGAVTPVTRAGVEITQCLLPSIPLENFGTDFMFVCIGPPQGEIVNTTTQFVYTTEPGQNAALIRLEIQAPSKGQPTWTLTGEQMGWSGAGTFTAQLSTDVLNGPYDFGPPPSVGVFFITLDMVNNTILQGQFAVSTYNIEIDVPAPCPWDLNFNGVVETADFESLLDQWGTDPMGPPDFDSNGVVDVIDFLLLLAHWGPCPE